MDRKRTLNNMTLIKLDPEYNSIKLKNGFELYVDNTFEPEKNATVTGEVWGLPSHLYYSGEANKGMPWETPMELKMGDTVIMFYLAVLNALKPETRQYVLEGKDRYVFISYENIYAIVRDEKIMPINGYCLIEPCKNPEIEAQRERMTKLGLTPITLKKDSITSVVYGIVRHIGVPNRRYVDEGHTDEGVDIAVGDTIVMKKVSDIPLQYNLHQKVEQGKPLFRVQRRNIFAKL
jgi:hypothetical protein